jgi:hypothetical protein
VSRAVGTGLLFGTLGSLLIVVPASLRTSASFALAWLVLAGSAALVLGPAAAALRVARPFSRSAWSVPLGLVIALPPLVLFARILKVGTNHRPLGGATFAIVAAGVVLGAIAFAARALSWEKPLLKKLVLACAVLFGLLSVMLSLPALAAPVRGHLLDGALAIALVVGVGLAKLPEKIPSWLGPAVWVGASAVGLVLGTPELRASIADRAPVLAGVTAWLR